MTTRSAAPEFLLSKASEDILKAASRVGHYMAYTKTNMKVAQHLRSLDLLELSDNVPGSFNITDKGEKLLSQLETVTA
jgi:predicted transcriptional regulator